MTDQRKSFDHRRFIDREFEQELFEELLRFSDEARLLTIGDRGGMGKSQLLQMFQYRCRTASRPRYCVRWLLLPLLCYNCACWSCTIVTCETTGILYALVRTIPVSHVW